MFFKIRKNKVKGKSIRKKDTLLLTKKSISKDISGKKITAREKLKEKKKVNL